MCLKGERTEFYKKEKEINYGDFQFYLQSRKYFIIIIYKSISTFGLNVQEEFRALHCKNIR